MKLSEFRFELPQNLVALQPVERGEARMMVVDRKTQKIEHKKFTDISKIFGEKDTLIVNDTKVFPARLYGSKEKTGAQIEVFLLRELNREHRLWDVLVDPARKIRVGNKLYFGDSDLVAEVIDNTTSRGRTIRFLYDGDHNDIMRAIHEIGEMPLPEEIKNRRAANQQDRTDFQTIFAHDDKVGAVVAPTAGLHFTKNIVKRMEINGTRFSHVTMHVGLGTFRQVEVEDLTKHKTDSEPYFIPEVTAGLVNESLDAERRVCSVGTTVLKTMESSVSANNRLKASNGWTDRFMFPPYEFKISNSLLTNLHLPESVLLMNACAFGGYELIMKAYEQAIADKYRFFSYGDAMLIL